MSRKEKAQEFAGEEYDIQVTGRNVAVTDAMKSYALDKVSKIERFTDRIIEAVVIMDIQKLDHKVEIIFKAGATRITSHAISQDMYLSIDEAVKKLVSQIRRYKSKLNDYHARDVVSEEMNVNVFRAPEVIDEYDIDVERKEASEESYRIPEITSKEKLSLKTLTNDEAIMKMELSNYNFMLFRSEVDNKLKVIYRRNDGHYGIIEPEA